jgi:drug/metabolite transporter (DMT)-like permease
MAKTSSLEEGQSSFNTRQKLLAAAMVVTSAFCFSTKAVVIKLAYRYEIDSLSLLSLRMIFSLPFFILILWWVNHQDRKKSEWIELRTRDWLGVTLLGLTGYYAASMFDFMGLKYITAGLERLILFLYPTIVLGLGVVFFKKTISRVQWIALGMTYLGVLIALQDQTQLAAGSNVPLGSVLIFLAGFSFAVYLVWSGVYIRMLGSMRYTCLAMIAAGIGVLLHHALAKGLALWHYEAGLYQLALIMAIVSTVIPTFLTSEAIRILGAGNVAIISSVGPVITIFLGYIFLGEGFGVWQLAGTVLVILGVLRISLNK